MFRIATLLTSPFDPSTPEIIKSGTVHLGKVEGRAFCDAVEAAFGVGAEEEVDADADRCILR